MIRFGDSPEGKKAGHNKYIGKQGDGYRGYLLAVSPDGKRAVMDRGDGVLVMVREKRPDQWPVELHTVRKVPSGWRRFTRQARRSRRRTERYHRNGNAVAIGLMGAVALAGLAYLARKAP